MRTYSFFSKFLAAGDHIVHHCPTWQWGTGDDSKVKGYLPKDKQFLLTRNGKQLHLSLMHKNYWPAMANMLCFVNDSVS